MGKNNGGIINEIQNQPIRQQNLHQNTQTRIHKSNLHENKRSQKNTNEHPQIRMGSTTRRKHHKQRNKTTNTNLKRKNKPQQGQQRTKKGPLHLKQVYIRKKLY